MVSFQTRMKACESGIHPCGAFGTFIGAEARDGLVVGSASLDAFVEGVHVEVAVAAPVGVGTELYTADGTLLLWVVVST